MRQLDLFGGIGVLALTVGTVLLGPPTVASAATATACSTDIPEVGSLDSDSAPDLAVGLPQPGGVSAIDVRYTSTPASHITDKDLDPVPSEDLGSALTSIDVNHDGCSELIAGAPSYQGGGQAGMVEILPGSPTGVSAASARRILSPVPDSDGFGAAVASASRSDGAVDLWVGAPFRTVNGVRDAGAVEHYILGSDGGVTHAGTVTAASLGGQNHEFAEFGSVLSARRGGVAVGVPDDTVSSQTDAGSVWVVTVSATDTISGREWTQDSTGVPGKAEAYDRFGFSVAGSNPLVVGSPYEDIGAATNTGMVTLIPSTGAIKNISQNSPGVPGANETGDHFGASVTVGTWLNCQENNDIAIGSPGENLGSVIDAGMVTILPDAGLGCPAVALTQGKGGLGGAIEYGDRVGTTLAVQRGRDDFDEDVRDSLVIGVPREDVGTKKDAGVVLVRRGTKVISYTDSAGVATGTSYGSVLTQAGAGLMFSG